ncbi:GGDEF domain-containing protein [Methylotuvimicrobium buryatense]|uniref:GGDEF domain-containing protein n=1 Tax=Methylotuvimicrobium buryatense TaxID=95641 RepID=A0A4P9UWQ3_METBY|nr:GGDEF domain-containing protein [Methylotuvimicrobium buryatense]QCW84206.1 GGDEF domain-containing protein [Methylotuvimicrobium buryatense]
MHLDKFILENLEIILQEWEDFAAKYLSDAEGMNKDQLRDHLREMLLTIAADLARYQSEKDQSLKAKGLEIPKDSPTPATTHGSERLADGFSLNSTVAEYRALRASVIRLWMKNNSTKFNSETDLDDLVRFNEAIDQAITEAVVSYSAEKDYDSRMFETILASAPDLIFSFNLEGRFIYANKQLKDLFGLSMEEMVGKNYYDLDLPIAAELHGQIEQVIRSKESVSREAPYTPFSGKLVWHDYVFTPVFNNEGDVESVVCIGHDVTERRASEHDNWTKANYDSLTGLPNRSLFTNRLEEYVKHSHRAGSSIALLFIDLDYFKEINDRYGHEVGDSLLKHAAERIHSCVRESDTAARLGGDEFIVILANLQDPRHVESVAEKIQQRLAEPFQLGNHTLQISASIGVSLSLQDTTSANELVNHADAAMYASKNNGRNQVSFYSPVLTH